MKSSVKVKVGDVYNLDQAIGHLVSSTTMMSGGIVYGLNRTSKFCESILKPINKKRFEEGKKHFKLNEAGTSFEMEVLSEEERSQGKMGLPKLLDGKEESARKDFEKVMEDLLSEEIDLNIYMISYKEWQTLQFNPQYNPLVSIIIDVLVEEPSDVELKKV